MTAQALYSPVKIHFDLEVIATEFLFAGIQTLWDILSQKKSIGKYRWGNIFFLTILVLRNLSMIYLCFIVFFIIILLNACYSKTAQVRAMIFFMYT